MSRDDPESVASILEDLGCRTLLGRFDLRDLEKDVVVDYQAQIVVVDAGDELLLAHDCRRFISEYGVLTATPTLLATTVPRLPSVDFSVGFDDFILSPVVPAELYARLRQLDWRTAAFQSVDGIKLGELYINSTGREVRLGGRPLTFTHLEFDLLTFLARQRGRVYSREQILQQVWGYDYDGGPRTVDIHVRRIRAKLGRSMGSLIVTVHGVGYKMS